MRSVLLACTMLAAGGLSAMAATDDELLAQIIGSWSETNVCAGSTLTFAADGGFILVIDGQDPADQTGGSFKIVDGVLTGDTPDGAMPPASISIDGDRLSVESGGETMVLTRCTQP
ncbi:MAG: hypothetical protein KDJ88_08645 [Bauldia sp.]|nr:hypothetical protein [Bauldia sp.]